MIVSFKITNFRSYKSETVFTLEALPNTFLEQNVSTIKLDDGETLRLLNTAGIFGANASGKSNVIWALYTLSMMVRQSRDNDVRTPLTYIPFLLDSESKNNPTEFDIIFITNGRKYRYVLEYKQIVQIERLSLYYEGKEELVFQRTASSLIAGKGWGRLSSNLELADVASNQLLLSWMGVKVSNGMADAYEALAYMEIEPVADSINLKLNNERVAASILKQSDSKIFKQLSRLVTIADTGIHEIKMLEHKKDEIRIPGAPQELIDSIFEQNRWEFKTIHTYASDNGLSTSVELPLNLESTGTKNLFGVGSRILSVLESGGTLVYDEMNVALHSELFKFLVDLFNNPKANKKNAQLIFTTHDATIARDGEMRADQIWFAEKNAVGESELYSAQDFDDASINMPFEQWYRNGRFGALPKLGNVNSVFEGD